MESPCLHCTRVRNPENCENKFCKDWQAWFFDWWETMREQVRKEMEQCRTRELGIPLGGHYYAHPHKIQEYLDNDPCGRCPCPQDVCRTPCPAKVAWSKKVNEVR